jgi:GNAT superfamily N-acetyltransferase
VDPENDDHLMGWMMAEQGLPLVHYIYVKPVYRRQGVARTLLASVPALASASPVLYCSHWSPSAQTLSATHTYLRYIGADSPIKVEAFDEVK